MVVSVRGPGNRCYGTGTQQRGFCGALWLTLCRASRERKSNQNDPQKGSKRPRSRIPRHVLYHFLNLVRGYTVFTKLRMNAHASCILYYLCILSNFLVHLFNFFCCMRMAYGKFIYIAFVGVWRNFCCCVFPVRYFFPGLMLFLVEYDIQVCIIEPASNGLTGGDGYDS